MLELAVQCMMLIIICFGKKIIVSSRPPLSAQGLIKMLSFINYYLEMKDETVIYKKTHDISN